MSLTHRQFGEFFDAKKNGTYKCPFCGCEEFAANVAVHAAALPTPDSPMAVHAVFAATEDGSSRGSHQYYSMSCSNCGHTDLFHKMQVDQWSAARAPETGTKDG
jgi:predicted nucleic-acid-binding Zn-ribbon protein